MKIHRKHKEDKYKQLCMKRFSRITSQNYEIVDDVRFFEILKDERNSQHCCKKCANHD